MVGRQITCSHANRHDSAANDELNPATASTSFDPNVLSFSCEVNALDNLDKSTHSILKTYLDLHIAI